MGFQIVHHVIKLASPHRHLCLRHLICGPQDLVYLLSLFRYFSAGHSRIHTHTSKVNCAISQTWLVLVNADHVQGALNIWFMPCLVLY